MVANSGLLTVMYDSCLPEPSAPFCSCYRVCKATREQDADSEEQRRNWQHSRREYLVRGNTPGFVRFVPSWPNWDRAWSHFRQFTKSEEGVSLLGDSTSRRPVRMTLRLWSTLTFRIQLRKTHAHFKPKKVPCFNCSCIRRFDVWENGSRCSAAGGCDGR